MKRVALAVALLIALAVPAWADAYLRGDYSTAFQEFEPFAKQGNPHAQYNLGLMYENGQGIPQNYAEALKWYTKAAEQGLAGAGTVGLVADCLGRDAILIEAKAEYAEMARTRLREDAGSFAEVQTA